MEQPLQHLGDVLGPGLSHDGFGQNRGTPSSSSERTDLLFKEMITTLVLFNLEEVKGYPSYKQIRIPHKGCEEVYWFQWHTVLLSEALYQFYFALRLSLMSKTILEDLT